jgi:hypothetical protein
MKSSSLGLKRTWQFVARFAVTAIPTPEVLEQIEISQRLRAEAEALIRQ